MTTWSEIQNTDNFYINVVSTEQEILAIAAATFNLADSKVLILKVEPSIFQASGTISHIEIYQNSIHVADCGREAYAQYKPTVVAGSSVSTYFMNVYKKEWFTERTIEKRCTCGGWAVYGRDADIHSDDISNRCELKEP